MARYASIVLGLVAVVSVSSIASGQAAQADPAVTRGKSLWTGRGCAACHAIGKKLAGPDMAGLAQRRNREWIGKFLMNTTEMLNTDPVAMAMVKEWKGAKMPQVKLTDADIDAILAYVKTEEAKIKK